MPDVYCVRAEFGTYTKQFLDGGYVAIGWIPKVDLSKVRSKEELYPFYKKAHPQDTSNVVIGLQVGQIARFLFDIKAGDFVITPPANTEILHYGIVDADPSYFYFQGNDGFPYPHRRRVKWSAETVRRSDFSVPFQNTIRASLTVYNISQADHFFEVIGRRDFVRRSQKAVYDPYQAVLDQLLELNDKEFEILITHLLAALGFEGSEHIGKTGDGGVDATGELNVANLAKVKIFVQVKRYKLGSKINANVVKALRQSIPAGGQGAFITTADFRTAASEVALETGFPRIGLVNGRQLVDLLVEHWEDIPQEFKDKLGLKPGLVRA
ncbi:MAG: restriction endonuclease [Acidobacteriota bacterium]|nr:restriction endonuclease [Acidobacteriota bacterium]